MSKDDLVSRLGQAATRAKVAIEIGIVNPDAFATMAYYRLSEAADRITALEAEVDAKNSLIAEMKDKHGATIRRAEALSSKLKLAEAALEPFAQIVDNEVLLKPADPDEAEWHRWDGEVLTVGDFRRARLALHSIRED